ncbi:tenascin-N isoform X2 [Alligator mississippiensis]|nr:tenascin-N isoform X2 [Alligator mississippiensis]
MRPTISLKNYKMGYWHNISFILGVLLYSALQTAALQLPASQNCTSKGQKISLSHSYKIDLPKSSQIQVEEDPLPLKDESHTLPDMGEAEEGEEQNIIFRHNIRVLTPKGDCEALDHLRALLERMEKLEKEVMELREACNPQKCCGGGQGISDCSSHGTFIQEICSCNCDEGWEGSNCSRPSCPNSCSGNGRCVDGKCICHEPYVGEDCSQRLCPENCSGNGICNNGVCQCYEEFIGDDCSEKRCPNDCNGNGFCDTGECYCHDGFVGLDCSQVLTPQNLQLLKTTEGSLTLSWDEVIDVDYYLISYYPMGYQTSVKQVRVPKGQLSYEIVGLHPSTTYNITLRHVKKGISSDPENLQASTALSVVGAIWVTDETEDSLEVEWENPPAEVDYYKLRFRSLPGQGEEEVMVPKSSEPKSRYIITGLKPGTVYNITVIYMKDNIEGKPSSVTGRTGIDGPTNLVTDRVTEDTATISWKGVQAPIDRYMVTYTTADGDSKEVAVRKDKSMTTLTGLRPGMEYIIYIWAEKGAHQSKRTSTKAVTEMDGPTNLVTDQVTEDTATISWKGVWAPIDRYMVSYTSPDGDARELPVGQDRSVHTLTGLRPGVEYTIYIWAEKGTQQSKSTNTTAVTEIDSPTNLVTDQVTEDTATISWRAVQAPIDRYMVSYTSPDGDSREMAVENDRSITTLMGLRPGMEYIIYIWAEKGTQQSKRADTKALTEIDSPTNLVTDQVTEDTATISWKQVQAPIDRYMVSYASPDGDKREMAVWKDKSITTLTGLRPGVEYIIYIWAEKGTQQSKREDTRAVTEIDSPTNLVADRVTENTATISWMGVQAPIDRYMVSYTSLDGDTREMAAGKDRSITLTGLRPGMEYIIYIWAEKGTQQSKRASTEVLTEIDGPTNLVTDQVTEDTATILWKQVQAPIDRYMVSYTSPDGDTREMAVGKDRSITTLTGLKPGVEYIIYIWAEKGTQQSKRADTRAVTEIDSPINLVTDRVTEDTATISWQGVQAPIDRYIVRYTLPDGDAKEMAVGKDKSVTTLTGLTPGMEYIIYIWAEKGAQQSKKANTKALTEIDPPKNLRVSDVTQSTSIVNWTPPTAQIDGYTLTYQGVDGTSKEVQLGPDDQRFMLEGLGKGVRYTVYVLAFKGDRRSRKASSSFSTIGFLYPYPADCSQMQQNGNATSGMYTIYLNSDASRPMEVYCDMTTDGGGWIVFQRRNTGELDFYKRWRNYVEGFGDPMGEFWLGLDKLHSLTSATPIRYEIRVDLRTSNESAYAVYDFFQVASSRDRYKLSVGNYRGTAGDALTYHNGWKFTTWDRDNDVALSNCALAHRGAWWYKNCHLANLNGKYGETKHSEGVNWEPWKGHEFSIPFTEMKIRPQSSSNEPILGRKKRSLAGKRKKTRV